MGRLIDLFLKTNISSFFFLKTRFVEIEWKVRQIDDTVTLSPRSTTGDFRSACTHMS